MAEYPVESTAPFSPPANREEALRRLEKEKLALDRSVRAAGLEKQCGDQFKATVMPKLLATGASPNAAEAAYSDWLAYFMRGETPPARK